MCKCKKVTHLTREGASHHVDELEARGGIRPNVFTTAVNGAMAAANQMLHMKPLPEAAATSGPIGVGAWTY
jgi:hypothetical protein